MNGINPPLTGGSLRPHRGTMILIFGILGLVVCFPFGIAAWVMGSNDLREMRAGRMDPSGEGVTQGGRICGMVATALALIGVIAFVGFMVLGASLSAFH